MALIIISSKTSRMPVIIVVALLRIIIIIISSRVTIMIDKAIGATWASSISSKPQLRCIEAQAPVLALLGSFR